MAQQRVSQFIGRSAETVAAFAGNPENLPLWAAGLSAGIRREGRRWFTDSPMGVVEVTFVGDQTVGILDHDVTLPDGTIVRNPMRVLQKDGGAEVVFTVVRLPSTSNADFERDVALVRADLARLRDRMEEFGP
ncbi:MAG TPA: SRPBCC family protein [Galbitalea sp.]|nr:SRPBCC family protein [Galbitalea sp.]